MMLVIEEILSNDEVDRIRRALDAVAWTDGRLSAGFDAALVKKNHQADGADPLVVDLSMRIQQRLEQHPTLMSAALPSRMSAPRFCRYRENEGYGLHVDASLMPDSASVPLRCDVSATLFLSAPDSYAGGELVIETGFGAQHVKLEAGSLVLYPSSSLHQVETITSGERLVAIVWIQSMVRSADQRALLYDLDRSIQDLRTERLSRAGVMPGLTGAYHNLVRMWSEK